MLKKKGSEWKFQLHAEALPQYLKRTVHIAKSIVMNFITFFSVLCYVRGRERSEMLYIYIYIFHIHKTTRKKYSYILTEEKSRENCSC
jgi:hypothetical protein